MQHESYELKHDPNMESEEMKRRARAHAVVALMKADGTVSTYERSRLDRKGYLDIKDVEKILDDRHFEHWEWESHLCESVRLLQKLKKSEESLARLFAVLLHDLEVVAEAQGMKAQEKTIIDRFIGVSYALS